MRRSLDCVDTPVFQNEKIDGLRLRVAGTDGSAILVDRRGRDLEGICDGIPKRIPLMIPFHDDTNRKLVFTCNEDDQGETIGEHPTNHHQNLAPSNSESSEDPTSVIDEFYRKKSLFENNYPHYYHHH